MHPISNRQFLGLSQFSHAGRSNPSDSSLFNQRSDHSRQLVLSDDPREFMSKFLINLNRLFRSQRLACDKQNGQNS